MHTRHNLLSHTLIRQWGISDGKGRRVELSPRSLYSASPTDCIGRMLRLLSIKWPCSWTGGVCASTQHHCEHLFGLVLSLKVTTIRGELKKNELASAVKSMSTKLVELAIKPHGQMGRQNITLKLVSRLHFDWSAAVALEVSSKKRSKAVTRPLASRYNGFSISWL